MKNVSRWLRKRRIAVLMGGPSAEREISLKTGRAILSSLRRQGFKAISIDPGTDLARQLQSKRINFAYIALHGPGGEDGQVQGLLEWMKIPYTGSGVLPSAVAMDKAATKVMFESAKLPTARWFALLKSERAAGWARAKKLGLPLVVKPATQGSAVGVSIVRKASQWAAALTTGFRYDTKVIVEKYIAGTEITVGVLGDRALPIIEIIPSSGPFYDFHAKYAPGGSRHVMPARIPAAAARKASAVAVEACRLLRTKGAARVDFIVNKRQEAMLLEVNTIPGMTETSLLPEAARAVGLDFDALVLKIVEYSLGH